MGGYLEDKIAPQSVSFQVVALRGRILTMDNLRTRKKIVVNAFPLCLCDEESVDHPLKYTVAQDS